MKKNSYVKIVAPNGNYRYGFISQILDYETTFVIDLLEEGESKIAFDKEEAEYLGYLPEGAEDFAQRLSDIEKQVAKCLVAGKSDREIAKEMNIEPVTVRAHIRNMRLKMNLENKTQLIAFCQGLKLNG